jgi:hypothetical protein
MKIAVHWSVDAPIGNGTDYGLVHDSFILLDGVGGSDHMNLM